MASAARAGVYEREVREKQLVSCVWERKLILLCGKCKQEIKTKTIGPCPCELCNLWYCKEIKKKEKLVQQWYG